MDVEEIKEKGLDLKEKVNVSHIVDKERKADVDFSERKVKVVKEKVLSLMAEQEKVKLLKVQEVLKARKANHTVLVKMIPHHYKLKVRHIKFNAALSQ